MIITRVLDLVCIYSHIEGLTKDKGAHILVLVATRFRCHSE